jgi:hypothetical protein
VLFTVALIVQSGNQADYDSDDEYIAPRSSTRQLLVNKQPVADPRVPNLDYRPIRNDAWSQRMREKVYSVHQSLSVILNIECPFFLITQFQCILAVWGGHLWSKQVPTGDNISRRTKKPMRNPLKLGWYQSVAALIYTQLYNSIDRFPHNVYLLDVFEPMLFSCLGCGEPVQLKKKKLAQLEFCWTFCSLCALPSCNN